MAERKGADFSINIALHGFDTGPYGFEKDVELGGEEWRDTDSQTSEKSFGHKVEYSHRSHDAHVEKKSRLGNSSEANEDNNRQASSSGFSGSGMPQEAPATIKSDFLSSQVGHGSTAQQQAVSPFSLASHEFPSSQSSAQPPAIFPLPSQSASGFGTVKATGRPAGSLAVQNQQPATLQPAGSTTTIQPPPPPFSTAKHPPPNVPTTGQRIPPSSSAGGAFVHSSPQLGIDWAGSGTTEHPPAWYEAMAVRTFDAAVAVDVRSKGHADVSKRLEPSLDSAAPSQATSTFGRHAEAAYRSAPPQWGNTASEQGRGKVLGQVLPMASGPALDSHQLSRPVPAQSTRPLSEGRLNEREGAEEEGQGPKSGRATHFRDPLAHVIQGLWKLPGRAASSLTGRGGEGTSWWQTSNKAWRDAVARVGLGLGLGLGFKRVYSVARSPTIPKNIHSLQDLGEAVTAGKGAIRSKNASQMGLVYCDCQVSASLVTTRAKWECFS